MSVRERSRLRPQLLERLGWRYMPLWTIEVFTDPSACADRIAGYLGLEKVVLPGRAAPSGSFLDDDVDQALNDIDAARSAPVSYVTQSPASGRRAGDVTAAFGSHHGAGPVQAGTDNKEAGHMATEENNNSTADERLSDNGSPAAPAPGGPQGAAEDLLPKTASEDDPRAWGDREDDDHDAWLKEQKPPHWG
jgi:hypothetical protein